MFIATYKINTFLTAMEDGTIYIFKTMCVACGGIAIGNLKHNNLTI